MHIIICAAAALCDAENGAEAVRSTPIDKDSEIQDATNESNSLSFSLNRGYN